MVQRFELGRGIAPLSGRGAWFEIERRSIRCITGVSTIWIGTSEYADAAGFAVVAELAARRKDLPIHAFTLMKIIGRDIRIGLWACAYPFDTLSRARTTSVIIGSSVVANASKELS